MPHTILTLYTKPQLPVSENIMTIASALMWAEFGEIDVICERLSKPFLGNVSHGVALIFLLICLVSVLDLLIHEVHGFLLCT